MALIFLADRDANAYDERYDDYAAPFNIKPQQYPGGNYFPPPPTDDFARAEALPAPAGQLPYAAYNPADYGPGVHNQSYPQSYGAYDSEANLGAPYPGGETFAGDPRYGNATPTPAHAHEGRRGREPDDVSAPPPSSNVQREFQDARMSPKYPQVSLVDARSRADVQSVDGLNTPRAERSRSRSHSRVRFDLASNTEHVDETQRRVEEQEAERQSDGGGEANGERKHRRRRKKHRQRPSSQLMNDNYDRDPRESDSDGTVDLPPRFDEHGNHADSGGDQLSSTLHNILGQAGFTNFLSSLGGGGAGRDNYDEDRSGRRRHRH